MQVTKVVLSAQEEMKTSRRFTQEQLQNEFNYMQAEKITKTLLEKGIITEEEFDRIMAEHRRTFPTFLAPLL